MIDETTRAAFADEMQKIAVEMRSKVREAVGAGWNGLDHKGAPVEGAGWRYGGSDWKRNLPGAKAFTVLTTAMQAPGALAKHDPSGRERSRIERVMGLAGNTLGSFAGSTAFTRTIGSMGKNQHPILAGTAGSILGGTLGERLFTAPFAAKRLLFGRRNPAAPPPSRPDDGGWRNQTPGGVHSPDAVVGQAQAI